MDDMWELYQAQVGAAARGSTGNCRFDQQQYEEYVVMALCCLLCSCSALYQIGILSLTARMPQATSLLCSKVHARLVAINYR